jgi:hypothetical protein
MVKAGDTIKCDRCFQTHTVTEDRHKRADGTMAPGSIQYYVCCGTERIAGINGRKVKQ